MKWHAIYSTPAGEFRAMHGIDAAHIEDVLINQREYTSYSNQLVRLIAKADGVQREVLRSVYPTHVEAFDKWQRGPTPPAMPE